MTRVGGVFINSIFWKLGPEAHRVADTPELAPWCIRLAQEGVDRFLVSDGPLWELAAPVAANALGNQAVSFVAYCSESFTDAAPNDAISRLLGRIEVVGVPFVGLSGHSCGNLGMALQLCAPMASRGPTLIVTADRRQPSAVASRVLSGGLSMLSDGAAACVLSPVATADSYELISTASRSRPDLDPMAGGTAVARVVMRELRKVVDDALRDASVTRAEIDALVVPCYGSSSRAVLAAGAGFATEAMRWGGCGLVGHAFAADTLLTLASRRSDPQRRHNTDLVLMTGSRSWHAAVVRLVEPGSRRLLSKSG